MNPVTLRAHESGQNGASHIDLDRYARRYGVDLTWLITGKGESIPGRESPGVYVGELVGVYGVVEDGAWHPVTSTELLEIMTDQSGNPISAEYTDPRFPAEIVNAFRVRAKKPDSIYPDGTILFAVPSVHLDFRDGDHVIVSRIKGDFEELSVKRIQFSDETLHSITSEDPPFGEVTDGIEASMIGIVVSATIRREVNQLSLEARKAIERDLKGPMGAAGE